MEGNKRAPFCKNKIEEEVTSCFPWRKNRWLHRWARKQKHESKDRKRCKPAKSLSQLQLTSWSVTKITPSENQPWKRLRVFSSSSNEEWRGTIYTNYFIRTTVFWFTLNFSNEIFSLVIFKTEVVPFSSQVFIIRNCKRLQIRDAIHKLNFKNSSSLSFSFKSNVSTLAN